MPVKNEIGNRYGKLVVLERAENNKYGDAQWLCQCDCGNQTIVKGVSLRNGHTKSCGCLKGKNLIEINHNKVIDLSEQRFGRLTVIEPVYNQQKKMRWLCQCECGSKVLVRSSNLLSGETKSCGCIKSEGEYAIAKYLSSHNYNFSREYMFADLRRVFPLRFDFAVFDTDNKLQFLIEYDGPHHWYCEGWQNIELIQECDTKKEEYCKLHGIPLYRINYSENIINRLEEILKEQEN